MNKRITTTLIALTILVSGGFSQLAYAVDPPAAGQALEIAPPLLNLVGNPGDTVNTTINIRDISASSLVVTSEVNDFTANGEDGVPKITLDSEEISPYSLKPWISPIGKLTLKPKQIQSLPVTITIPKNASPGGYYGVVRFTAAAPGMDTTGVSLSASLGTLIFLRVSGDAKESMTIDDYYTSKNGDRGSFFDAAPVDFSIRMKNTGNVYERPVGRITVTDLFGQTIANVNMNLEQRAVLPGSTRKFDAPLDKGVIGSRTLFGMYRASLSVSYGNNLTVQKNLTFWVIPWRLILGIVIGIIGLIIAGRVALNRYNERLLGSKNRSRRR